MLVSHNWLQKYFDAKLPKASVLADKIIFHAFEVEDIVEKDGDCLMDVKVLPDRAHDCLCHYGLAKEISALFDLRLKSAVTKGNPLGAVQGFPLVTVRNLNIKIEDEKLCRRYIGRMVENVAVKNSADWLKKDLEKLDQRSIFNIVDLANYVMFDVGQPLHAFDADKVQGGITVRLAKTGEKITTLDNQEVNLDESILIIADDEGPLAIAGIKGGKKAEVTNETKNLILESANFDPVNIRQTAQKIGIRTDASKRFENEISTEVAGYAMDLLTDLIIKEAGTSETKVGEKVDEYKIKNIPAPIEFAIKEFSERLGVDIAPEESIKILESLGIEVEVSTKGNPLGAVQGFPLVRLTPPVERLDLQAKENYVEEVGRIYGYDKIAGVVSLGAELPNSRSSAPKLSGAEAEAEKRFNLANKIRVILKGEGFTEVYGYTFTNKGEVEVANPLASDKKFLRTNLTDWLIEKIKFNLPYVLFDNEAVKIFEIGKVFVGGKEETRLGLGIGYKKKIKGQDAQKEVEGTLVKLAERFEIQSLEALRLDLEPPTVDEVSAVQEFNFDKLSEEIKEAKEVKLSDLINKNASYKLVSPYPRIIRDVAVWVPENTQTDEVAKIIKESAGELCVAGPILFDEFAKEGRKSLAFRLVFQSYTKTLSDDETNAPMAQIIKNLEKQAGFEVRK
ncbi:MAG: phenylalanine--tRNA ligase subunit beta [Candidatus Paceibacterota bacterium]|jgi:phenylalanyl-tRNA synthetase beta chain